MDKFERHPNRPAITGKPNFFLCPRAVSREEGVGYNQLLSIRSFWIWESCVEKGGSQTLNSFLCHH